MLLELAALVCGIIARKSAAGKAGAILSGVILLLSFLLCSMTAKHAGTESDEPAVQTSSNSAKPSGSGSEIRTNPEPK